jgi:hypothetical protein
MKTDEEIIRLWNKDKYTELTPQERARLCELLEQKGDDEDAKTKIKN